MVLNLVPSQPFKFDYLGKEMAYVWVFVYACVCMLGKPCSDCKVPLHIDN